MRLNGRVDSAAEESHTSAVVTISVVSMTAAIYVALITTVNMIILREQLSLMEAQVILTCHEIGERSCGVE